MFVLCALELIMIDDAIKLFFLILMKIVEFRRCRGKVATINHEKKIRYNYHNKLQKHIGERVFYHLNICEDH